MIINYTKQTPQYQTKMIIKCDSTLNIASSREESNTATSSTLLHKASELAMVFSRGGLSLPADLRVKTRPSLGNSKGVEELKLPDDTKHFLIRIYWVVKKLLGDLHFLQ